MKIHEYQGKELFRKYGVPVPIGIAALTVERLAFPGTPAEQLFLIERGGPGMDLAVGQLVPGVAPGSVDTPATAASAVLLSARN